MGSYLLAARHALPSRSGAFCLRLLANDGNFCGTTALGGQNNTEIIYHLSLSDVVSTLYSFGPSSGTDGVRPAASLIQATDGSLYGTTLSGGDYQQSYGPPVGTVFKIKVYLC
jgi:hypothetical protein